MKDNKKIHLLKNVNSRMMIKKINLYSLWFKMKDHILLNFQLKDSDVY